LGAYEEDEEQDMMIRASQAGSLCHWRAVISGQARHPDL